MEQEKLKSQAIDIIEKAYAKDTVEVSFDLGGRLIAWLSLADAAEMFAEQERIKSTKTLEYREKGYGGKPIDERKWKTYLNNIPPEHKDRVAKEKPVDLAEQFADEDVQRVIIKNLVAKCLRDEDGKLLFPDEATQSRFGRRAISTPKLTGPKAQKKVKINSSGRFSKLFRSCTELTDWQSPALIYPVSS